MQQLSENWDREEPRGSHLDVAMAQGSRTQIWKGPSEVKSTINHQGPCGELHY